MVGYYQAYKGSTQTPLIYSGGNMVRKVYKGSTLVYQLGFDTVTFNAGASLQTFTVPLGVSKIHVDCVASKGGDGNYNIAGKGGRVECDLAVTGGQTLYIVVGDKPQDGWSIHTPVYNASDIRTNNSGITDSTSLNSRLIVAGGGGSGIQSNESRTTHSAGADGGGLIGASSNGSSTGYNSVSGATGGTQFEGGSGQNNGQLGLGGAGYTTWGTCGAGGAGYYGGGGGRGGAAQHSGHRYIALSGGGGGSSYTDSSVCSNVIHTQGYNDGAGYITISFVE